MSEIDSVRTPIEPLTDVQVSKSGFSQLRDLYRRVRGPVKTALKNSGKDLSDPNMRHTLQTIAFDAASTVAKETAEEIRGKDTFIDVLTQERDQAREEAGIDALTGLPDKGRFLHDLKKQIAEAKRAKSKFYLIFMDFNFFKDINDAFGHSKADEILRVIPALKGREEEEIYRFGGDEFVQIINNVSDESGIFAIARRYQDLLKSVSTELLKDAPIQENINAKTKIRRTARLSIGITPYLPSDEADDIVNRADGAMYFSKSNPEGIATIAHKSSNGGSHYSQQPT